MPGLILEIAQILSSVPEMNGKDLIDVKSEVKGYILHQI